MVYSIGEITFCLEIDGLKTSGNDKWEVGEWGYDGEMGILLYSYSA